MRIVWIALALLAALPTACAVQRSPESPAGYTAPQAKCQLGRREAYVSVHHCEALGGIALPRVGQN